MKPEALFRKKTHMDKWTIVKRCSEGQNNMQELTQEIYEETLHFMLKGLAIKLFATAAFPGNKLHCKSGREL